MNGRPTPETDAEAEKLDFKVDLNFARKLERERDEARQAFVIATDQAVQAQCKTREALRERDEAREELEEEKSFHNRTHAELVQTQCKVLDLTQAIIATLEENRHLADGDDCTLAKLKSVVPDWK